MIVALIDANRIVQNVIVATVEEATTAFGGEWVECPAWVGIGMSIDAPKPLEE